MVKLPFVLIFLSLIKLDKVRGFDSQNLVHNDARATITLTFKLLDARKFLFEGLSMVYMKLSILSAENCQKLSMSIEHVIFLSDLIFEN